MRYILSFFCILISFPAFANSAAIDDIAKNSSHVELQDELKNELQGEAKNEAQDEIHNQNKYNYVRNRAQISPKKAHKRMRNMGEKSLDKNKAIFQKTKDKELWLLRDNANLLEYSPN